MKWCFSCHAGIDKQDNFPLIDIHAVFYLQLKISQQFYIIWQFFMKQIVHRRSEGVITS